MATHHRTYRVTVSLARVSIRAPGEAEVKLDIPDGQGKDYGLDIALDHIRAQGRRRIYVGHAPKPQGSSSGIVQIEHWLVVTEPVEPVA